ncbi:MAG: folate-binding protein, partial [Rhizobiaceae bacterium]|nr:folate-binding protein [Rhizobiaceae bacterium]
GTLGTVAGSEGLAIVRTDRVKDALDAAIPITAGEAKLGVAIPAWAGFGYPSSESAGA